MKVQSIPHSFCENFTRPEQKEFSETDRKTYVFVVLSYFLITLGIALALSSFYLAPVIHPIITFGSAIVSIALGILLHPTKKTTEKEKAIAYQPLGLKNGGLKCWLNAPFQLICHIPAYQKVVENIKNKRP